MIFYVEKLVSLTLPALNILWRHWKLIIPIFLFALIENTMPSIGETGLVWFAARFGTEIVAVYGITGRLYILLLVPFIALFIGIVPFVGQNWGAGNLARIKQGVRLCIKWAVIYWAFITILMFIMGEYVARQFTDNETIIYWITLYYRTVQFTMIGSGMIAMLSGLFYGIDRPTLPSILQIVQWATLFILAPFWIWKFDLFGLYISEMIAGLLVLLVVSLMTKRAFAKYLNP